MTTEAMAADKQATTKIAKKKTAKKTATKTAKKTATKTAKKTARKKTQPISKSSTKVDNLHLGDDEEGPSSAIKSQDYDLVIVESPSKAKTIKKYLGRGYQVIASNGHIKDLPKSKLGVDIKEDFALDLVPITNKKDKIKKVQEMAKYANIIYLAPDPDREGEAIAYHLAEEIGKKKKIYRVLFNAITKKAVNAAIESPTELDSNKYDSQKTRRVLDRLVGYKISPILWEKVQRGLSAGRVQSVALRIIVDREDEIKIFKPEQWFSIHVFFEQDSKIFEAKYFGESPTGKVDLTDIKFVEKILLDVAGKNFVVKEVRKKDRKQNPSPPFTTSKLQQEAANKLGFTAKRTMMVAQKLYEGINLSRHGLQGLITYMRTDSVRTDSEAMANLREFIKSKYGPEYLADSPIIYKKKGTGKVQDAHEAIRPTSLEFHPALLKSDLSDDEFKLYSMIWNKFVSSQMSQALIDQTSIILECANHFFKANGSVIKFPGFRTVYLDAVAEKASNKGEEDDEDGQNNSSAKNTELPVIEESQQFFPKSGPKSEEHWTTPPPRYNEASLVKDLEEKGIGRPSTYASIISNIQDRGYVEKTENRFVPTELGQVVCKMLVQSFPDVMDVEFTAKVEEKLDHIEEGQLHWKVVLRDFWDGFEKTLEKAKDEMKNLKRQEIPTGIHCEKCADGTYLIKWGRNGQFLACSHYPDCNSTQDFKRHLDGQIEIISKEYVKDPCPTCGKRMVVKTGRYGRFLTCEDYPNCKTTMPYLLDVPCPKCETGRFAEKRSKYGKVFYGCNNYPNCDNAMWTLPRSFICPECGHPVMGQRVTKRAGEHLECPKCKHKVSLEETPFHNG